MHKKLPGLLKFNNPDSLTFLNSAGQWIPPFYFPINLVKLFSVSLLVP